MLNHKGTQEIRTKRLLLRRVREEDYKDMYQYMHKDEVARYVTWEVHKSPDITKAVCKYWSEEYADNTRYNWAIELEGKAVGNIDVVKIVDTTAYMGWQLDSTYWNKGFITEAAAAVRDYLFSEIGIDAIEASHIQANIASGKVMQKLAMTMLPTEKSLYYKLEGKCELNGMPVISYKLTKEEWQCKNIQSNKSALKNTANAIISGI